MLVFDMAGTTIDEQNVVYRTLHAVLGAVGYHMSLETVLAIGAGKEKRQAMLDLLKHQGQTRVDEKEVDRLFAQFRTELARAYAELDVQPQPGAPAIFAFLKEQGAYVVLNTGYDRKTAESLIQKLGWQAGAEYDLLVTADDVERSRPFPDMIRLAAKKLGVEETRQIAKVGDSQIDIEEGQNAGCGLSIGITTGAQTREQLTAARADLVVDHLDDLRRLF